MITKIMKTPRPSLNRIFKGMDTTAIRNKLICRANREHGYSASAIAKELNIHRSTVGRILKQFIVEDPSADPSVIDSPVVIRIIETAVSLLAEGGREALSLRRLATELAMSATNLYNYFKDKDDLLDIVRVYGFRKLLEQVQQNIPQSESAKKRLQGILDAYFDFGLKQADLYEIMFSRKESHKNKYSSLALQEEIISIDGLYSLLREVLQEFITQTREISPSRLREIALMLWSQVHGLICLYVGGNFIYMSKQTQKDFWAARDRLIDSIGCFQ